ncbi:hypothetical protein BO78DRAFT_437112 [Aspergillus sclerotiicarbonarius CBS 121057]|uniref:Uncharacterized protein n=1 Tax=Aspergillus sclerotiicarbonarius (strain CBS 121057 / IBT 28362) TaxID=1448318 RepID=A0A319DT90_ASPSB|nr:hypothetical protein BO78DRAFT_437112 [Aspergillus sclerotiicarbonarius CBS 121057]
MCGPSRPSSGKLIAVIFPPSSSSSSSFSSSASSASSSFSSSFSSSSSSEEYTGNTCTSYSLSFQDPNTTTSPNSNERKTKALFRISSPKTLSLFRESKGVNVRIEKYGDLTAPITSPPLYDFKVPFSGNKVGGKKEEVEVEVTLPERLELGVSERGIVGRLVRVSLFGDGDGNVDEGVDMGRGIVGYD